MENNGVQNWSGTYGTLDFPTLPNPFAESDQSLIDTNSFAVNDAPPKVFFPPKMPLTKELEYKKRRPILEHISTSIISPHKLALKPTTSHPLNHQITTSPITPTFFNKFHKNNDLLLDGVNKRHFSPKIDVTSNGISQQSNKEKIKQALGKRRSMPKLSINTNIKNDLLKEVEKKMVIAHEIKPSDTIAGVALLYGIEISALKKSNKLWTNDSIHLRKFLYVPIDQCSIIDDEAKVVVQDDHISIKTNRSLFSDNIIRPSFSPTSTGSPSTPFTIYERELLFCTLPEHANYSNHDHHLHSRQISHASTSSIWSITSSSSSNSSTTSNNNITNNFTRAEIQQLPADQLTFFPSKRASLANSSTTTPNTPLTTPKIPSPSPVSHLNRHKQHRSISYPLPTMTQDTNLVKVDEKYHKRRIGSVKTGMDRRIIRSGIDPELLSSLNTVCNNKNDPKLVSPTYVRMYE